MSDITDRIRKLLSLSRSSNEHEAAQAAARAAELMREHEITEAMIAERDKPEDEAPPEAIVESGLADATGKRVAWRETMDTALARSLDCEVYVYNGKLCAMGRASAVATWLYTAQYLHTEVERLADAAWLREGPDLAAVGQTPRRWKAAFRLGAADTVRARLVDAKREASAKRKELALRGAERLGLPAGFTPTADGVQSTALAIVERAMARVDRDRAEVAAAFKTKTAKWRPVASVGNSTRGRSGYSAGREAGHAVNLDTSGTKKLR